MVADTRKNVIILTTGLAGSSVLAGLLGRAGYWLGRETFSKSDYATHENTELIALNQRLFEVVGYTGNYEMVFDPREPALFSAEDIDLDLTPFQAFISECDDNGPWLWKDPRLWLTVEFWSRLLDLDKIQFVTLTREPMQSWISGTIRRQIQTPAYCRSYIEGITGVIAEFLARHEQVSLELLYEDLLLSPDATIARLNEFLGTDLGLDDLQSVFHGRLGRRQRGFADLMRASLIYAANFGQRYR